jgi:hypothetical protein
MPLEYFEGASDEFKTNFESIFNQGAGYDESKANIILKFIGSDRETLGNAHAQALKDKENELINAREAEKVRLAAEAEEAKKASDKAYSDFLNGEKQEDIKRFFANVKNADELASEIDKRGINNIKTLEFLAEMGAKLKFNNGAVGDPANPIEKGDYLDQILDRSGIPVKK